MINWKQNEKRDKKELSYFIMHSLCNRTVYNISSDPSLAELQIRFTMLKTYCNFIPAKHN